jgi:hypothetical protein
MDLCDVGRNIPARRPGCGTGETCPSPAIHLIVSPISTIKLCDDHFQVALSLGLVKEPNIGQEEYDRRERMQFKG